MININGNVVDKDDAKISVFDRGFLFGDSVYEVVRTYKRKLFLWNEHFERLKRSAQKIGMTLEYTREELTKEIYKTIEKTEGDDFYIRLIVTHGEGGFSIESSQHTKQNLVILAKEMTEYPKTWYQDGVKVIIADTLRTTKDSVDPSIKSGNYLNNVMAYNEAAKIGYYDAIMLNSDGEITEATTSNIWFIRNNTIYTPELSSGILDGITRRSLLKICDEHDMVVVQKRVTIQELKEADECFLTSSTKEIIPVVVIDQKEVGTGLVGEKTKLIHKMYKDFIEKEINDGPN